VFRHGIDRIGNRVWTESLGALRLGNLPRVWAIFANEYIGHVTEGVKRNWLALSAELTDFRLIS
jgi:hypothetical protein